MSSISEIRLKPGVHWVKRHDFWILRNPIDVTFIQVKNDFKATIDDITELPIPVAMQKQRLTRAEVHRISDELAVKGMLVGTEPPKPPKRKFTPLDLLYMRFSLINPDDWLTKHVDKLRWIWTKFTGLFLLAFLAFTGVTAIDRYPDILLTGKNLMATEGGNLLLPFVLLTIVVVSLHELAHAFTLKHYDGIVPDMGVFFILLIPACYTNASDSYGREKKYQEVLVIAAGIICQILIAAFALILWNVTDPVSSLHSTAYILMVAALFTVALNLNPLSGGFDGYHLTVALTGINNLRSRSRLFYLQLIKRHPLDEDDNYVRWVLAIYAPLSLAYAIFVFTFLIWAIVSWTGLNIPAIAFTLLVLWLIYFFAPKN